MSERPKAFLAMPFRDDMRWVRHAIAAACREANVDLVAVDEKVLPGTSIVAAIRHFVAESTFAYVVISDLNPNVLYELGLLHGLSKPTVLLSDKRTMPSLPFDLRSLMVVSYDGDARNEADLRLITLAATTRVLQLVSDPDLRSQIATGEAPPITVPHAATAQLSVGTIDWGQVTRDVERAMGLKGCQRRNLIQHGDDPPGWKLKLRCQGGTNANVNVDLNGEIREIDVE